jgi:hypothetical protein
MLLQQKQLRDDAVALVKQFLTAAQVNGRVAAMCRYRHKVSTIHNHGATHCVSYYRDIQCALAHQLLVIAAMLTLPAARCCDR